MLKKDKISYLAIFILCLAMTFISGCVYLTHFDQIKTMKNLAADQKAMQAELDKQERLYNKLKADIDRGRLKKQARRSRIIRLYGEPILCRRPEKQDGVKETCIYRKPTGRLILLNLDTQGRLVSWKIQNP